MTVLASHVLGSFPAVVKFIIIIIIVIIIIIITIIVVVVVVIIIIVHYGTKLNWEQGYKLYTVTSLYIFSGFSVGFCINEEKFLARKITC